MLRILLFSILFTALSFAEEKSKMIEVTAKTIQSTKTTVSGSDGVVVYYGDAVIKANKASYNKETKLLVLDGKVEMIGYRGTKEHAPHLEIQTDTNEVNFKELFLVNQNDVWLYTDTAHRLDGNYTFGRSVLSSCDVNDPLWKMAFERSKYDSDDEYMKVYDAKMYFMDVPVMYTPYMAFSTNNKRASGLLFPLFGYSGNDGFVYEQPVFWAISDSMDLELNPQIRTNRSKGMYATYRFVDSPYSSGKFRLGYFKDDPKYVEEYELKNETHYGLEFLYDSSRVISQYLPKEYKDGLFANITLLNDIEYLNLQKSSLKHFGQVPLQESRVNYFLHNNNWYGGLNAKYFIDTRLEDNNKTIQILPALQFHKYLTSLFSDNLTYSLDMQTRRLDRIEGTTLNQMEFRMPISFTASLFDDYLNFTLEERLYSGRFFIGNDDTLSYDNFQYNNNIHAAKIFTDLTRKYSSFTHVLQPYVDYVRPGIENSKPVEFEELIEEQNQVKELFAVGPPEEQARLSLNQYFYDTNMKLIFYQRLQQNYYPNREKNEISDINNEMQLNWNGWSFYNNIYYSYEFDDINEVSSRISVGGSGYSLSIGHTFKQQFKYINIEQNEFDKEIKSNDINFNFHYTVNDRISINGGLNYNLKNNVTEDGEEDPLAGLRLWRFGGDYKRDCWSLVTQVSSNVVPRAVSTGSVSTDPYVQEYSFTFQLSFTPFATVGVSSDPNKAAAHY